MPAPAELLDLRRYRQGRRVAHELRGHRRQTAVHDACVPLQRADRPSSATIRLIHGSLDLDLPKEALVLLRATILPVVAFTVDIQARNVDIALLEKPTFDRATKLSDLGLKPVSSNSRNASSIGPLNSASRSSIFSSTVMSFLFTVVII